MNPDERSMTGEEYRKRCEAIGLPITVLAKCLGMNRRSLHWRFQPESVVRIESVLALEMLEHRVLSARFDKALSKGL